MNLPTSYTRRFVIVDVEATGAAPGVGSMTEIGAVLFDEPPFKTTFHAKMAPIFDDYDPEALAVCGYNMVDLLDWPDAQPQMEKFDDWLASNVRDAHGSARPIFVSDNPAWDFQWINYYFFHFLGRNPFGHSGRRIGDIWSGMMGNLRLPWKNLRKTPHTHNPVDDAMGNAEALWHILSLLGKK